MTTTLAIHHLGLKGAGDATLFVALRDGAVIWSLLCDGGLAREAQTVVIPKVAAALGGTQLTAIVSTHYDADHLGGISELLATSQLAGPMTLLLDRGAPTSLLRRDARTTVVGNKRRLLGYAFTLRGPGTATRARYLAIVPRIADPAPTYVPAAPPRSTAAVITDPPLGKAPDPTSWRFTSPTKPYEQAGFCSPGWLISTQGTADALNAPLAGTSISVTIIAANRAIRQQNQPPVMVAFEPMTGLSEEELAASLENQGCLALLVRFGSFTYYCPGDLESPQEAALIAPNGYLAGQRIHAMKLSHHGSTSASAPSFLAAVKPLVAIASNGISNIYGHPAIGGLASDVPGQLDADQWSGTPSTLLGYFMTGWFYGSNLRGHLTLDELYNGAVDPETNARISAWRARVAGSRETSSAGDILLTVTASTATGDPEGFEVQWRDAYFEAMERRFYAIDGTARRG